MDAEIKKNVEYHLAGNTSTYAEFLSRDNGVLCDDDGDKTISGTLNFQHIDREEYIASGVFQFITTTSDCDTVKVTDGRFDLHYAP